MTRDEAIMEILGLDQLLHAERGSGPYDDGYVRRVLRALGVTDTEIDAEIDAGPDLCPHCHGTIRGRLHRAFWEGAYAALKAGAIPGNPYADEWPGGGLAITYPND